MRSILFMLMVLLLTFTGCSMNYYYNPHAEEQGLVENILYNTAKIIEKKYHMKPVEAGAAMPAGEINKFHMSYEVHSSLSKNQLRVLLLNISNVLLNQITANVKIQTYLVKTPFTIENVKIIIFNYDKDGRRSI